jgi:O-antigen/teichoic acid export membrane protein/GT2 family glycosyltransferase
MKTRSPTLFGQFIHTFSSMVVAQAISIVAGIILARSFGPAGRGLVSYAATLALFGTTIAEGIRLSVQYQIGALKENPRDVYGAALRMSLVLGLAGAAGFAILSYIFPDQRAFPYVAIVFPFAVYTQVMSGFYQVNHRIERTNIANLVLVGGSSIATIFFVVLFHISIGTVLGIWVLAQIASSIIMFAGSHQMLGGGPLFPTMDAFLSQLKFALRASLSSGVTFLALRIDVLIVSARLTATDLGLYTLALALAEVMWQISRAVTWTSAGRVATLDRPNAIALTARLTRSLLALQLCIGVVLFAIGPWLIVHVYGARFELSGAVLRVLLLVMVLYSADGLLSQFISVKDGRPGFVLAVEVISLVLCVGGTLLLIPQYGIFGAAVAKTVAFTIAFVIKAVTVMQIAPLSARELLVVGPSDLGKVRQKLLRRRRRGGSERETGGAFQPSAAPVMSSRPTLAIVIPTKNRPVDIQPCLASIFAQDPQPDRIVIVDQSDTPYELAERPNLTHIHDRTIGGASAARNVGAAIAATDLLLFIDDDVLLEPGCVQGALEGFARYPNAVALQCTDILDDRHDIGFMTRYIGPLFEFGFFNRRPYRAGDGLQLRWLHGYAMGYRSWFFEREGFDETLHGYSLGEDWELSQRARRYGEIRLAEGANVQHRRSDVNRNNAMSYLELRERNFLYFYRKLDADSDPINRVCKVWWLFGEWLTWTRNGRGLDFVARALRGELGQKPVS